MTEVMSVGEKSPTARRSARCEPLTSNLLSGIPGVIHGLTNRARGLGVADGNVGYGAPRDQADAWAMRQAWSCEIGFDPHTIVGLRQVHGSAVRVVTSEDAGKGAAPGSSPVDSADALITDNPGVTLMTLHADCLPILVVDPEKRTVAAIHSGWRGTVEDVAGETVRAMQQEFGSDPARLLVFFGPSIGPCCYEVGPEVADAWEKRANGRSEVSLIRRDGTWTFDLRRANEQLLRGAGVVFDHIEISDTCTKCNGERWFSHRGQGANTGRFAAFIALRGTAE